MTFGAEFNAPFITVIEGVRRDRRGQILISLALMFGVLLAFMGLVFDGGRIYYERVRMQAAADAGALASNWEQQRRNLSEVTASALHATKLNGFEDGVNGVNVQVTSSVSDTTVTVVIDQDFPTTFLGILGVTQSTVAAQGVAAMTPYGDACIIALDRSATDALRASGGAVVTAACGIMSNSADSTRGMRGMGGAVVTSSWTGVTGGVTGQEHFTPAPETGVPPILDPMAHVDPPDYAAWPAGSYDTPSQTYVCPAGNCVFSGEIKINNGSRTFQSGTYVLQKGLKITGGDVTGTGVCFYNVNASGKDHIDIGGNGDVQLSAPTSGPMKGILFFADRNSPYKNPGNKIGRGNSASYFEGALYFPSQHLDWAGSSNTGGPWSMVIAKTIDVTGTAGIGGGVSLPPDPTALPGITRPMLTE